jgi:glutamate racemase
MEQDNVCQPTSNLSDEQPFDNAPIGVFDSGYGGLTVARAIAELLPNESIVFFGDEARCPYGPRPQEQVDQFVQQICTWLVKRGVKLLVIACNTATAAGLEHAQQTFDLPIIGAVEPGARAAARATKNRRVGVIGTKGTIASGCYPRAIRHIDAGITVFSTATPKFVEIVERGIKMASGPIEDLTSIASKAYIRPAFQGIARDYLEPLRRADVDTVVLGCTHYPMLKALIGGVMGHNVLLVTSSEESAKDVRQALELRHQLAQPGHVPTYEFYTCSENLDEFQQFGSRVFNREIARPTYVPLEVIESQVPGSIQ